MDQYPPDDKTEQASKPTTPVAIAIGVDLMERERLIRTYQRFGDRFLRKVFTDTELDQAGGRIERLAGRFAAKEACAKALGTGIGQVAWKEIEIVRLPGGKPSLQLHGRASELAASLGLTAFDVSISDTHGHALAVVVGVRS
ncbi:MAG TPA: holo-ACP synthase [Ktedonobacterales bacterium]|nr:holo-ACP synthase [Ktedonobacterales bacterium]